MKGDRRSTGSVYLAGIDRVPGPRFEVTLVQPRVGELAEGHTFLGKAPSLRRSPLPHRDQPMLGRQPRLGVTCCGKGHQAGVSGQVRTDVGPLIPLARKLADVPETPVARLASHRTVLSVMRSEGTSVANPVH